MTTRALVAVCKAIADYTGALFENGTSGSVRIQPADQNCLDDRRDPPLGLPVNDFFQSTLPETTVARMRKNNSFIAEYNLVDDVAR